MHVKPLIRIVPRLRKMVRVVLRTTRLKLLSACSHVRKSSLSCHLLYEVAVTMSSSTSFCPNVLKSNEFMSCPCSTSPIHVHSYEPPLCRSPACALDIKNGKPSFAFYRVNALSLHSTTKKQTVTCFAIMYSGHQRTVEDARGGICRPCIV